MEVAQEKHPDLILLDVKMPNGSGIQAFENLQNLKATKDIPVIFITAYPKPEVKELVLRMGAEGFVTKPFNGDLLNKRIENVLRNNLNETKKVSKPNKKLKEIWRIRNDLV